MYLPTIATSTSAAIAVVSDSCEGADPFRPRGVELLPDAAILCHAGGTAAGVTSI